MQQTPPAITPLQTIKSLPDINASASATASQRSSTVSETATSPLRPSTEVAFAGEPEHTSAGLEKYEGSLEPETAIPPLMAAAQQRPKKGYHRSSRRPRTSSLEPDPASKKLRRNDHFQEACGRSAAHDASTVGGPRFRGRRRRRRLEAASALTL